MSVSVCQEQVQMTLQNEECSYSNAFTCVHWGIFMLGHTKFPRKYDVDGKESFIVSLESTARVFELQLLQRCEPTEEGAKQVPLAEHIVKELGPIHYKRCEGVIKTANRVYSVTFEENSNLSQKDRDLIKELLKTVSIGMIDGEDLRKHPWSETNSIGVANPEDGEEYFIHNVIRDFNPYLSAYDPNWPPKAPGEKDGCLLS